MNCHYTLISNNKIGNILHCPQCDLFIIGFGTTLLKFSISQSKLFSKALNHAQQKAKTKPINTNEKIFLKTPVKNILISLNIIELEQTIELIEMGLFHLEIQSLISNPSLP